MSHSSTQSHELGVSRAAKARVSCSVGSSGYSAKKDSAYKVECILMSLLMSLVVLLSLTSIVFGESLSVVPAPGELQAEIRSDHLKQTSSLTARPELSRTKRPADRNGKKQSLSADGTTLPIRLTKPSIENAVASESAVTLPSGSLEAGDIPETITVSFEGCGSGSEECSGDWGFQRIDYFMYVEFEVVGVNPSQVGDIVSYELSSKIGTIHFYGTAEDQFWGETTVLDFDRTQSIEIQDTEGILEYPTPQYSDIYIGFSVPPSSTLPCSVYIQYSGAIGIVRNTVNMPYPWDAGTGCLSNNYDVPTKECCAISIELEKECLPPGETTKVYASGTEVSPGQPLEWELIPEEGYDVKAIITPDGGLNQSATITDAEGKGYVLIRVTNPAIPDCQEEKRLYVGCDECADDSSGPQMCALPGGASLGLAHVATRFGLGRTSLGRSAGGIFLPSGSCNPLAGTPQILEVDSTGDDVEVVLDGDVLRQVVAPESFFDIVVINALSYNIFVYDREDMGNKINGIYQVNPGATPRVTWTIEDSDGSLAVCERLKMTETRNGNTRVFEYAWNESENTWTLSKGDGVEVLQVITRKEETIGGNRVVTETIKDGSDNIASKVKTTYADTTVNGGTEEEIIEIVQDPDNHALTTTKAWYEDPCPAGSCGKLKSQVNPDGSWVTYQYDTQGRRTVEIRSWLDVPFNSAAAASRAVYYDYTPHAGDSQAAQDVRLPRTVTEEILGNVVGKTYYVYVVAGDGTRTEIAERCANPGAPYADSANQRTVTEYYPFSASGADSWRVKSITYPDSRLDRYTYEYGTYTPDADPLLPGTFTPGAGTDVREQIVHGTISQPAGIPYKTTGERNVTNDLGDLLLQETYVYEGGASYRRVQWTVQIHDDVGHVTSVSRSDGTLSESTWDCCGKDSDINTQGITKFLTYDVLGRLKTETKDATDDIITTYTYNAAGRRLTQTTTAGGLSQSSSSGYDTAGRLAEQTDTAGLVTGYAYSAQGRVVTVTRPGGATEITERYPDGRTKSITGTGVVPRYYSYGVNADGTQWTQVYTGSPSSPMWEKTTTNMLGRTVKVERPGFAGIEATDNMYNNLGQLVKTTTPGLADTLYEYDEIGNQTLSGLDIDQNGTLDKNSADRISETQRSYTKIDEYWWDETTQKVYAEVGNSTPTVVGIDRRRLTGVGSGGLTSETVAIDIHGNQTVGQVVIDRGSKTVTQTTDYPDSTIDTVSLTTNGLLLSSQSKTGVTTTFTYDPLERRTGVIDPRTGLTTTNYNAQGWVDYVEDPAGNRTEYAYDPATGRKTVETNALNNATRFAYNDRGQVTRTWGDATYPVEYLYDTYGRMTEMHTWREELGWTGETWPGGATGTGDVTIWHYQDATGLLVAKEDDAGQSVSYTYAPGGKLATRTWARTDNGAPIVTTHSYDPDTGELLGIDYSDSTPDITITYNRLGRTETVADGVGNRTFAYNDSLQLESETITGLYDKVISRSYETSGMIGRPSGFGTGADYNIAYGYDNTGRFNAVQWNVNGISQTATYTYIGNSDLINQLTTDQGQQTTYSYEPNRDFRTQVKNEFNGSLISEYDYQYDAVGRRTSVQNAGPAFETAAFNKFDYNDRNELEESARYIGPNVDDLTNPVQDEYRQYDYDPIGNRTQITEATDIGTYTANALNQYTEQALPGGGANTFTYDLDGNLTEVTGSKNVQYTFNAENRLVAVEPQIPAEGDKKLEFTYDYIGRRVKKDVYTYSSGSWLLTSDFLFLYNGWNLISELTTTGARSGEKYYVWGLDLSQTIQGAGGVGGLIASAESLAADFDKDGDVDGSDLAELLSNPELMDLSTFILNFGIQSGSYSYFYDGNGNLCQLVDAQSGNIASHYEYDPYGNIIEANRDMADDNPYRFSTKYYDAEAELYYYGYRYYLHQIGRWLNRDPFWEEGGMNLYGFGLNQPTNLIDRDGRSVGIAIEMSHYHSQQAVKQLIRIERAHQKARANKLINRITEDLCPNQGTINVTPSKPNNSQCCTAESCKGQATRFANAYAAHVTRVRVAQLEVFGSILGGGFGNLRNAYRCSDWADDGAAILETTLAEYFASNKGCLRGSVVSTKKRWEDFNFWGHLKYRWMNLTKILDGEQPIKDLKSAEYYDHFWIVMYHPKRNYLSHTNGDLAIDPWESAGDEILVGKQHEIPGRLERPINW